MPSLFSPAPGFAYQALLAVTISLMAALWLSIMALQDRLTQLEAGVFRQLVIVDDQGNPRLVLDGGGDSAAFSLRDALGNVRMEASLDPQGTGAVFVLDPDALPRLGVISSPDGTMTVYQDRIAQGQPDAFFPEATSDPLLPPAP